MKIVLDTVKKETVICYFLGMPTVAGGYRMQVSYFRHPEFLIF